MSMRHPPGHQAPSQTVAGHHLPGYPGQADEEPAKRPFGRKGMVIIILVVALVLAVLVLHQAGVIGR